MLQLDFNIVIRENHANHVAAETSDAANIVLGSPSLD